MMSACLSFKRYYNLLYNTPTSFGLILLVYSIWAWTAPDFFDCQVLHLYYLTRFPVVWGWNDPVTCEVLIMSILFRWRTCGQVCPELRWVRWATCTLTCRRQWTRSWMGQLKLCCRRLGSVMPSLGRMWMQHWTAWCSTPRPLVPSVLYFLGDSGQYVCLHTSAVSQHLQFGHFVGTFAPFLTSND